MKKLLYSECIFLMMCDVHSTNQIGFSGIVLELKMLACTTICHWAKGGVEHVHIRLASTQVGQYHISLRVAQVVLRMRFLFRIVLTPRKDMSRLWSWNPSNKIQLAHQKEFGGLCARQSYSTCPGQHNLCCAGLVCIRMTVTEVKMS